MYFRVSKYTNIDTRYTMISCIVYKALLWSVVKALWNALRERHKYGATTWVRVCWKAAIFAHYSLLSLVLQFQRIVSSVRNCALTAKETMCANSICAISSVCNRQVRKFDVRKWQLRKFSVCKRTSPVF